jgi:hypothetical protein
MTLSKRMHEQARQWRRTQVVRASESDHWDALR